MIAIAEGAGAFLIAGGGGAAVAFLGFRLFGEKWLDSKFAGRLQELRHEHNKQIENIRLNSSKTLDRSVRLAEREFDATFEVWGLVTKAHFKTMAALPGFRRSSDFSKLSDKLAKIASEQAGFAEWEIDALLEKPAEQRNDYFHERRAINEIANAKQAIWLASEFLSQHSLFIVSDIRDDLDDFLDRAWKAMVAWEIVGETRHQGGGPADLEGLKRDDEDYRKGGDEKLKAIEKKVRERFWESETTSTETD